MCRSSLSHPMLALCLRVVAARLEVPRGALVGVDVAWVGDRKVVQEGGGCVVVVFDVDAVNATRLPYLAAIRWNAAASNAQFVHQDAHSLITIG
jgi:hypothetical protein